MAKRAVTVSEVFGQLRAAAQESGQAAPPPQLAAAEAQFTQAVAPDEAVPDAVVSALKALLTPSGAESAPAAGADAALATPATENTPADHARREVGERRQAFRQAAAVLATFDPARLRPVDADADPDGAWSELQGDLVRAYASAGQEAGWALRPDVRQRALVELGTASRFAHALEANPDRSRGPQQRVFESLMLGQATDLQELATDELRMTLQAVRWLEATDLPLPKPEIIRQRIEERRLLGVFEQLAEHFVGRERELALLRDYVGVLPPSSGFEWVKRQVRQWFDLSEKPPLVFYAAGGVGKTTLIAKFLIDHTQVEDQLKFPYVYLDFDSPALVASQPGTVLAEAARQLAVQYPDARADLEAFVGQLRDPAGLLQSTGLTLPTQSAREAASVAQGWRDAYARFAALVRAIVRRSAADDEGPYDAPFLIVVDTYEGVQLLGIDHEYRLWELLGAFQRDFRSLRIVVFGRGQLDRIPATSERLRPILIEALEQGPAELLLERLGVAVAEARREIYARFGGNPLSLKLAAQVYRDSPDFANPASYLESVSRRWRSFFSAGENVVQGQLYQRILRHIGDPDVRRLAHPGLVLRRVTPELIMEVLQEPCGVPAPTLERAEELFAGLREQVALVTVEADGSLRHRPDVRRVMLRLIERDKPDQVNQIHQLAVAYYVDRPKIEPLDVARAEELYHRLQLGQDAETIAARWRDGVGDFLRGSMDELTPSAQHILATLLGIRLPENVLAAADLESWERYTSRQATEAIGLGKYDTALELLAVRRERSPGSPLHLLEAQALVLLGRTHEAERALERALAAAEQAGDRAGLVNALLLGIEFAEQQGAWREVDERLAEAEELTRELGDAPRQIELALRRLRLRQATTLFDDEAEMGARLAALVGDLPDAGWRANPELLREATARIGFEYPDLLLRLLHSVGVGPLDSGQRSRLAGLLTEVARQAPEAKAQIEVFARTIGAGDPAGLPMESLLARLLEVQRLDEFLRQFVFLIVPFPELRETASTVLVGMADEFLATASA